MCRMSSMNKWILSLLSLSIGVFFGSTLYTPPNIQVVELEGVAWCVYSTHPNLKDLETSILPDVYFIDVRAGEVIVYNSCNGN